MTIGELVEILIRLRDSYDLSRCEDDAVCNACNILSYFPRTVDAYETLRGLRVIKGIKE